MNLSDYYNWLKEKLDFSDESESTTESEFENPNQPVITPVPITDDNMINWFQGDIPDSSTVMQRRDFVSPDPSDHTEGTPSEILTIHKFVPEFKIEGSAEDNIGQLQTYSEDESISLNPMTDDLSYNTLVYLMSLGYQKCKWSLSWYRGRILFDVCDVLQNLTFDIQTLLDESREHASGGATSTNSAPHSDGSGYRVFKPAPIFSHSHPNCRCSLLCYPPKNVNEIPSTAPGLPLNADEFVLENYKKVLIDKLKIVRVDRWTILDENATPSAAELLSLYQKMQEDIDGRRRKTKRFDTPDNTQVIDRDWISKNQRKYVEPSDESWDFLDSGEYEASSSADRIKFGDYSIKPVKVSKDFMYDSGIGILRPIPLGYKGFIIDSLDNKAQVYLVELNAVIEIPFNNLEKIELRPTKDQSLYGGAFMQVNDTIGIAFKVYGTEDSVNTVLCYLPEFDDLVEVNEWIVLEMI